MKSITTNVAASQFKSLIEQAQHEPIEIKKYGTPVAVIMSIREYNALKAEKIQLEMECLKMRLDVADKES
ncbi:type II toxin-antitoxin system Phd/YefM family antitoxin [Vibrio sp. 404]|uniref:Antitoxin n=1 Tax=Vibrio marinisediminis TaxID=2758441 RepID=A0A7W2FUS1_9VIBR|nr:type II toxin-antitoxin system Phd/YefM family antitoxin [Vibrio marinisediminis]MBA5764593.1 type II toxin-antitoxin system Phd/YefM family antitoxin [Vibrio marinisediminis]